MLEDFCFDRNKSKPHPCVLHDESEVLCKFSRFLD